MVLFFDLDGTLTDPVDGISRCIRHALVELGMEPPPEAQLRTYIGPPLLDTFAELCPDPARVDEAVRLYRERYAKIGLYENRLYDGIVDCLEQLRGQSDPLFVVTSKLTVFAERIIEHFGLASYFRRVYGSEPDGRFGDKSQLITRVLENEAIAADQALMIGDRKYDIVGARQNGVDSIGVLWGYGSRQELTEAGAHRLCASPLKLAALIKG